MIALVDGAEIVENLDAKGLQEALILALGGGNQSPGKSVERGRIVVTGPSDA